MAQEGNGGAAINSSQWRAIQSVQKAAQVWLAAPTSGKARANLTTFQKAFNAAYTSLEAFNLTTGNAKANGVKMAVGASSIATDGAWGAYTARAMAVIIWISFPQDKWLAAATDLASSNVLNGVKGALPTPRSEIAAKWLPRWNNQVQQMVWADFPSDGPSVPRQNPVIVPDGPDITQQNPSVPKQNPPVPGTATGQMESSSSVEFEEGTSVQITRPAGKSLAWLWITLGLAGVGGGLWWMFGRKKAG